MVVMRAFLELELQAKHEKRGWMLECSTVDMGMVVVKGIEPPGPETRRIRQRRQTRPAR